MSVCQRSQSVSVSLSVNLSMCILYSIVDVPLGRIYDYRMNTPYEYTVNGYGSAEFALAEDVTPKLMFYTPNRGFWTGCNAHARGPHAEL